MTSSLYPNPIDYTLPESIDTVPNRSTPVDEKYCYENKYGATQMPTIYEDLPGHRDMSRRCLLYDGVVDDCYKSRFYARALEFYLLEDNPELSGSCRCLMENCPQRNFTNPKDMLRHLKGCPSFSQGLFRCPACNDAEKFQTVSRKCCSWNREKFSQKVQRKFKATIKSFTHHYSGSKLSPTLGVCEKCGQILGHGSPESSCPSTPDYDHQESAKKGVHELQGDCSPSGHNEIQPNQTYYGGPYGLSNPISNQSSSSNPSTELASTPSDEACIRSVDVSPLSTPDSCTTVAPGQHQGQLLPANQYRRVEGIRSTSDIQGSPMNGDYFGQADASWARPQSSRLYIAPTVYNPVLPASCGPLGLYEGRGQTLSIQTDLLGSNTENPVWANFTFYNEGTLDTLNAAESPILGRLVPSPLSPENPQFPNIITSPLSQIETSTPPNVGAYVYPSSITEKGDIPQIAASVDNSPLIDPELLSSSPDQQPDSDPSEQSMQCPFADCDFKPTGKPENYKSYLRKHTLIHGDQRYKCDQCPRVYTRSDNREVHRRRAHSTSKDVKRRRDGPDAFGLENKRKRISRVNMI
ncbi:hypothetical protein F5Y13DRAFT_191384 [Hypoxylon sp. FL1857]|nr:hypothetical protein F5Y13DRAFT_191384 [Hypoxylon sp. FL1857]